MFIREFVNTLVVHPFEKRRQLIAKFLALTKELENSLVKHLMSKAADHQHALLLVANDARPVDVNRKILWSKSCSESHYVFEIKAI